METRVYSPEPALKNPGRFFRDMWKDLLASRELAIRLAQRDISAMYRQSMLGYVWAFLPVLGTTGVFLFLKSGAGFSTSESEIPYPVYVLVGTILWQVFVDAVNGPLKVVTASRAMLVKINFPRESLILAGMLITGFNFVVRLMILIPALVWFAIKGQYVFDPMSLLLFPAGVAALVLLGYCIGVLLTPLGMLYKDVSMGVQMIMMFWMFLSPVVVVIPESGMVAEAMKWNLATPTLDAARAWLVGADPMFPMHFAAVVFGALVFLGIGWVVYRISLPHVIARLGM